MRSAPLPVNEAVRLQALQRYEVLNTPPEADFDDLARLAAEICGTPITLISFETATDDASTSADAVALDCGVLERLQKEVGGSDSGFVAELIELFLSDTQSLLTQIKQALAQGEADVLERAAHTLKSSSASVGARSLAVRCDTLEGLARERKLAEGAALVRQIEAAYAQAEPMLCQMQAMLV